MAKCVYFLLIQFISVITSILITNALLLNITFSCCICQVHTMIGSVPGTSRDLETSTEVLLDFDFDHNSSSSPQVLRQCVYQDSNSKTALRLFNCNLSYIHQRAFDEWPDIKVSKCRKRLIDFVNNICSIETHNHQSLYIDIISL